MKNFIYYTINLQRILTYCIIYLLCISFLTNLHIAILTNLQHLTFYSGTRRYMDVAFFQANLKNSTLFSSSFHPLLCFQARENNSFLKRNYSSVKLLHLFLLHFSLIAIHFQARCVIIVVITQQYVTINYSLNWTKSFLVGCWRTYVIFYSFFEVVDSLWLTAWLSCVLFTWWWTIYYHPIQKKILCNWKRNVLVVLEVVSTYAYGINVISFFYPMAKGNAKVFLSLCMIWSSSFCNYV